jgi:hypothetical protein
VSARNRLELFEAESHVERRNRRRSERHRANELLHQARTVAPAERDDIDIAPSEVKVGHHHPRGWVPKAPRVWRMPFWKRRSAARYARSQAWADSDS